MAINVIPGGTGDTTFGTAVIKTAFDQYFEGALRHKPLFRNLVDKRPVQVTSPGQTVTLFINNDLAEVTEENPATAGGALLVDGVDVTPVANAAPSTVDVVARAYGRAVVHTTLLREFSLTDVSRYEAEQVAWDMENTIDKYVRFIANSGTNVEWSGAATSTATVTNTDTITSSDVRSIVADLRTAAVMPKRGELYASYIHPHAALDLRQETGSIGWRPVHEYSAPNLIWKGEVGTYEGAFFVETGRAKVAQDGTGATPDAFVYRTLFLGAQALVEGVAIEPSLVFNGKVGADHLSRLYTLGWHGVLGWNVFRQEALRRLESGSSKAGAGL